LPKEYKENISIIKSGHHGGKNTVNNEMAKNSNLFIISTGLNIYNHPNQETLEIIEQNNKKYLRTDEYNAIKIAIKNNEYKIGAYSPKQRVFKNL
jgi:competence protein ComEC